MYYYGMMTMPFVPLNGEQALKTKVADEALIRARREIATMPFESALRLDDNQLMRIAVRHALEVHKEMTSEGV